MDFYSSLAKYYDEIFPLREPQKKFFRGYLARERVKSVLDIGCATGSYTLEFSAWGTKVVGIDLSEAMIQLARDKAVQQASNAEFHVADMLDLTSLAGSFNTAICLGNTLAHLTERAKLQAALAQFAAKADRLVLQVVNYDRILAQQVTELPEIRTPNLVFRRYYKHLPELIEFTMQIERPGQKQPLQAANLLYPLTKQVLDELFAATEWHPTNWWGNYVGEAWSPEASATIVELKKQA